MYANGPNFFPHTHHPPQMMKRLYFQFLAQNFKYMALKLKYEAPRLKYVALKLKYLTPNSNK